MRRNPILTPIPDLHLPMDCFAAGDRITVGTGGTVITTTGIGSVGIGTTNPTQKLHLNGDFRITGTIYDSLNQPRKSNYLIMKTATGGGVGQSKCCYFRCWWNYRTDSIPYLQDL